jgi:hypothetical protein
MAHDIHQAELELPLSRLDRVPQIVKWIAAALLVIGGIAVASAFVADPERGWRAYLFNWLFWTSVAQGAVIFSAAVAMARGIWSRPVRRVSLSFVAFLPISLVLLIPLLLAGKQIFPWYGQEMQHGKEAWLNMPFLGARNLALILILTGVSIIYAYWALRPDIGLVRANAPERLRGLYDRFTRGWRGQEIEEVIATRRLAVFGPIMALLWATAHSVLAWDFIMSLEAHWFSTMIGPLFFMGGFLGGIAATALLTSIYRSTLGLGDYIQAPQFHDLGKLTFAFCVFWVYLFWSQFLVIWYGMLPAEQTYLVHRFLPPYASVSTLVIMLLFVIPFIGLIGVVPKRSPVALSIFSVVVLVGLWLERYVQIFPSYYHDADQIVFGWQEIGFALPFGGLMLLSLMYFATRFPLLQIWQPMTEELWIGSTEEPPGTAAVASE